MFSGLRFSSPATSTEEKPSIPSSGLTVKSCPVGSTRISLRTGVPPSSPGSSSSSPDSQVCVPVIFSPLTYAVIPTRISSGVAVASDVSIASYVPVTPYIFSPFLMFSAIRFRSPVTVTIPNPDASFGISIISSPVGVMVILVNTTSSDKSIAIISVAILETFISSVSAIPRLDRIALAMPLKVESLVIYLSAIRILPPQQWVYCRKYT